MISRSRYIAVLKGVGRADIAAYGVADAEARIEKELGRILPGAHLEIRELRRTTESSRIVETFELSYRLRVEVETEGASEEAARRAAFQAARRALDGTRFRRIAWERADLAPRPESLDPGGHDAQEW